ncbi:hypothetical protein MM236_02285 [Belliella sp. DSM 107340]|uniref:Uncharacterized protein n=1 Tax=Belliella calami TaxID=2923436 RepID=A0ABS9UJJ5_9BACT|nr:hypothetical protein [Belliella calami]MCH7396791.1 hypothetical protein [Belliella calami]
MTEEEFDLLDELYFVQHFDYLKDILGWEEELLLANLQSLLDKDYIKCLYKPDEEVFDKISSLKESGKTYYYLATKKGLMNHNSI